MANSTVYDGGTTGGSKGTLTDFFSRFKFLKNNHNQVTEILHTLMMARQRYWRIYLDCMEKER